MNWNKVKSEIARTPNERPHASEGVCHSSQVKAESLVAIAMGNAHRNRNEKQPKPCKGVSRMSPFQGLMGGNGILIRRAMPYAIATRLSALIWRLWGVCPQTILCEFGK